MIQKDLTIDDFNKYFECNRLGDLSLPNLGHAVDLRKLYKLITGWKINETEVPLDEIIGILAFGSAVRYPSKRIVPVKKKMYGFFGPEITIDKEEPIIAKDADFFVLTRKNLTRDRYVEPIMGTDVYGDYRKLGELHVTTRGIEQIVEGVKHNDFISTEAVEEGVPVFSRKEELENAITKIGVKPKTPRRIFWDESEEGKMDGEIK